VRDQSTVRRQPDWNGADDHPRDRLGVALHDDPHDDDLFVDGDERRRQRLLSIGAVKPEPRDQDLPRFVRDQSPAHASAPAKAAVARPQPTDTPLRRPLPAWVWALLGFIVGIGFWHAIGFWGFISEVTSSAAPATPQPPNTPTYQPARPTKARN
jgi:hypothetical protein